MQTSRVAARRHGLWKSHGLLSPTLRCRRYGPPHVRSSIRSFHVAPVLMPPLIFGGLFMGLWIWKCAMLVAFQNMIIYNPFLPPNSRSMTIAEFARDCGKIQWREERIRSLDGTGLGLCVADVSSPRHRETSVPRSPVYILYFQGEFGEPFIKYLHLHQSRKRIVAATSTSRPILGSAPTTRFRGARRFHDGLLELSRLLDFT